MSGPSTASLRIMVITTVPQTMTAFFPRQLSALAAAGFTVHAVSSPDDSLDQLGRECGITTHGVPMERQPNPRRDAISLWRLLQLIRRIRPHVVHAHTPKAGLLGMAAAKLVGVPVRLYTVHGLPLLTRGGVWRRLLEAAERTSAALSTRTYCVSHSIRKLVADLGLSPEAKVFTLGDGSCAGVALSRFQPQAMSDAERTKIRGAFGIPPGAVLVTFVGRLARDKGVAVLADAWTKVASQRADLHLLLAGEEDATDPVPPAALDRLRRHASVHATGAVSVDRIPALYAASDLCVLPTFREGLSQVTLEAGAMGLPVVSCKVSGLDAVEDGVTGLLVDPGDSTQLAEAILALARDPERRRKLGRAASEHIRAKFCEERVNQLWMAEYRGLIAESLSQTAGCGTVEARGPERLPESNRL